MNKKAINITTVIKGMFLAVLIGICAYSVKDTFCDIHVVYAGDNGGMVFMNDAVFEEFKNKTEFKTSDHLDNGEFYYDYYMFYEKGDYTVNNMLAHCDDIDKTRAEKAFSTIYNSKIIYYSCDYEKKSEVIGADINGMPQYGTALYFNGTTAIETDRINTTYAEQMKAQNGYKTLEEIEGSDITIDEDTNNYVVSLMKDFRTFAVNLQNSDVLSKNDLVKQRMVEFCMQAGMDRDITYGLVKYALDYGESDIRNLIANYSVEGSTKFEDYGSKKELTAYSRDKHKPFYYFLYHFYLCDIRGQKGNAESYEIDDLDSYYIGIMGHITLSDIKPLNSGAVMGLGKAFLKVLSATTDELAESVTQTLARDVCWGIIEVIEKAEETITDFSPSLEKYLDYFGGVGASKESDVKELFNLNNLFYYIGAFLLVLIALIQLVTIIVNPEEAKTDIPHLVARFIILAIFIYWGRQIISYIFDITNKIWNWCMDSKKGIFYNASNDDRKIFYKAIKLVTYDYFGIEWTYSVVGVIFNCAVGFIIIKNIFMVLAECIERYIVAVLLYFTFPTALSFGVSNTTSNILVSYFRMLGTQLFMLFMNLYFVRGFVILLDNFTAWANSFYGLIFVIAYLKVAQAFDSYLSSLGLSVAHTSGRMASELLGVGSTLLAGTMMLGRIGMSVGRGLLNTGARGVGNALSTGAIMSGSQGNGALKAFSMGENLRAQGLRGLLGGARLNANTLTNLNSAQTGRFGLTQASTFKNAMAGGINGGILNANKQTSGKALLDALGTGLTANGRISDAKFNSLGGGLAINGSVRTAGGKTIATSGQLSLTDSQLKAGHGMSAPRTFGVAMSGDVMRGSFAYNTSVASGDSFKLNKDSIQKIGGEYVVTDAELGLGANFLANEAVRTHTLDLASQGHDITLTKQANGNIMVSDGSDIIGYTSEHGDRWFTDSKERAITIDDFNGGALTYLRPNENCEAINIITMDEVKDGTLLNPTSMDFLKDHNFGEDATIVLFKDKETDELYAKEVHPTMESESENVRGDYTVVNLDTKSYNEDDGSTVIKGDEDQIYDRDYRKAGNNRHPKNP